MALERGTRLGPYEITDRVGAGGMGEVYRAHDPRLGRDVAIKVLPQDLTRDPDRLRRFEIEARAAAALNHPNILAVYDIGEDDETPFVVSELLEGQTLRRALLEGPVPLRRVLDYARQISAGLSAAHSRGIVHRDLKPENIFLTTDGRVKILDFGLAKVTAAASGQELVTTLIHGPSTRMGAVLGTVGYMAPEQATGKPLDFRCDQFAFGIVLYELLSGRRTFERSTSVEELAAIIRDEPRPLADLNPEVPLPLQWLIARCLAKDPLDRYESTRDLVRDLDTMATHLAASPVRAAAPEPASLPVPRTALIGRDAEVEKGSQLLLRDRVRLVTFTGAAGTGKTRLALQLAADLKTHFPAGVFFAGLSATIDPTLVANAVAQAFGVRPTAQTSIVLALRDRIQQLTAPALLVLDNFEHLISAGPFVAELVASNAPLKILVTSREPLRVSEEHEFPVLPLARPDPTRSAPEMLAKNPAVMLFIERATASKPDFSLTGDNARAIAEICNRLDGLPLAIELAAARVKTLPPNAMLGRLQSRLQILTGGARDLPARQQTLRGAIAWSHDLLTEPEQRLFRRLSVFVGGCTFEATEAVSDVRRDLGIDVIDGIDSLVNKSLLQLSEQPDGEARLTTMETIREYGLEQLAERGEEALVRKAHAAYYLVLAEEAATNIEGSDQPIWLDRLDRDLDNIRAALDWLTKTENVEWGLRLGAGLLRYWELRELFAEGRERLDSLLRVPGAAQPSSARAKAVFASGVLGSGQRDFEATEQLFKESCEIYRSLGETRGVTIALNALANTRTHLGDHLGAQQLFEEAAALSEEIGDRLMLARALSNQASMLKEQRAYDEAQRRHQESMTLFRELGDETGVAWSLHHQADIARELGDRAQARMLYERALAGFESLADPWSAGTLRIDLASLALDEGNLASALERLREAVDDFRQLGGHKRGLARALEGYARAAAAQGRADRAMRLAGAAAALRRLVGTPLLATEQQLLLVHLQSAHDQLTASERSRVWMAGCTMTMEEAIEFAVENQGSG